jgi:hypothetical protein
VRVGLGLFAAAAPAVALVTPRLLNLKEPFQTPVEC